MKYWVSIALVAMVAATFSSASWAGDNGKAKGIALGKVGDGNPKFQWRAAEDSVDKNSNQVLLTTPDNVCQNPISAAPGRNPHCAGGPTP
jgi:hypothetical protein